MTTTVDGITITGSLARALVQVESLLSESSAFQTRLGKSADGLKADHIFFGEESLEALTSQPGETLNDRLDTFAVVCEEAHGWDQYGQDNSPCMGAGGQILVIIRAAPRHPQSVNVAHLDFVNFVSTVIDEVATNQIAETDEAIFFNQISQYHPPFRSDLTRRLAEDCFLAAYLFKWGTT